MPARGGGRAARINVRSALLEDAGYRTFAKLVRSSIEQAPRTGKRVRGWTEGPFDCAVVGNLWISREGKITVVEVRMLSVPAGGMGGGISMTTCYGYIGS